EIFESGQGLFGTIAFRTQDHGVAVFRAESHEREHARGVEGVLGGFAFAGALDLELLLAGGLGQQFRRPSMQPLGASDLRGDLSHLSVLPVRADPVSPVAASVRSLPVYDRVFDLSCHSPVPTTGRLGFVPADLVRVTVRVRRAPAAGPGPRSWPPEPFSHPERAWPSAAPVPA